MKPYKILFCPNYVSINVEILNYLEHQTELLTNGAKLYANFIDVKKFTSLCPSMVKWAKSLNMTIRDAYFSFCTDRGRNFREHGDSPCQIHLDKPPVHWKINWPVLNMEGSCVRFFKLKDDRKNILDLVERKGDANSKDNDAWLLDYKDFEESYRHNFRKNEPIIMDGLVPHDVGLYDDAKFPRIGIQMMLVKEPIHLL
jgi:hypothetical protein